MEYQLTTEDLGTISLKPGDCLLYRAGSFRDVLLRRTSIFSWFIGIKTWHDVAHCETYVGNAWSVASRNGIGVDKYPIRLEGLIHVLRPVDRIDLEKAMRIFRMKYKGQKYDWVGLLRFAWRSKVVPDLHDNRQFCSEFLTRFYRAGGLDPFNKRDADEIAPCQFLYSDHFLEIKNNEPMGVIA